MKANDLMNVNYDSQEKVESQKCQNNFQNFLRQILVKKSDYTLVNNRVVRNEGNNSQTNNINDILATIKNGEVFEF